VAFDESSSSSRNASFGNPLAAGEGADYSMFLLSSASTILRTGSQRSSPSRNTGKCPDRVAAIDVAVPRRSRQLTALVIQGDHLHSTVRAQAAEVASNSRAQVFSLRRSRDGFRHS
jgi:hypothetical protein